jgi:hypothetical protein
MNNLILRMNKNHLHLRQKTVYFAIDIIEW